MADGVANSGYPDQTAPSGAVLSESALFAICSNIQNFYGIWTLQSFLLKTINTLIEQSHFSYQQYSIGNGIRR